MIDGIEFEGLEVILINKEDPNEKDIYLAGLEDSENSAIHVHAHGNSKGIRNRSADLTQKTNFVDTKSEWKAVLKKHVAYEQMEKQNEFLIILHACNTGAGKNSFAERMSTEANTTIIAPDALAVNRGPTEIGVYSKDEKGNKTEGNWLVFKGGVIVGAYKGSWDPKANPSWADKLEYKKVVTHIVNVSEGSYLNLRKSAGTSAESLGKLKKGTVLTPTGEAKDDWLEVKTSDGQRGWVSSKYTNVNYGKTYGEAGKSKKDI